MSIICTKKIWNLLQSFLLIEFIGWFFELQFFSVILYIQLRYERHDISITYYNYLRIFSGHEFNGFSHEVIKKLTERLDWSVDESGDVWRVLIGLLEACGVSKEHALPTDVYQTQRTIIINGKTFSRCCLNDFLIAGKDIKSSQPRKNWILTGDESYAVE